MKLPMDPNVYMCYIIYPKHNFRDLAYRWNKESKTHRDNSVFSDIKDNMRYFRKKHWNTPEARGWSGFDTRHLMGFINKYLKFGRKWL